MPASSRPSASPSAPPTAGSTSSPTTKSTTSHCSKPGGRHDLAADERFATPIERVTHSDSLYRDVASVLGQRTTAEWLELCEEHGIPATEAATLDELVSDLPIDEHPVAGPYRVIPPPEQFSKTPPSVRRAAPKIGEHGREILNEIGYQAETIEGLIGDGILTTP